MTIIDSLTLQFEDFQILKSQMTYHLRNRLISIKTLTFDPKTRSSDDNLQTKYGEHVDVEKSSIIDGNKPVEKLNIVKVGYIGCHVFREIAHDALVHIKDILWSSIYAIANFTSSRIWRIARSRRCCWISHTLEVRSCSVISSYCGCLRVELLQGSKLFAK
ncbi:hypothetical protein AB4K20DRAFT_1986380 [Rhizopus microsporus]